MAKKRYLVIGGSLRSPHDGQFRYIGPRTLAQLYLVDPRDCIFASGWDDQRLAAVRAKDYTVLRPQYDGDYTRGQWGKDRRGKRKSA